MIKASIERLQAFYGTLYFEIMQERIEFSAIVCDPEICHGAPTFRGTRIFVADVLEQVAMGMAWESIIEQWRGAITRDAIAEAVRLARRSFLDRVEEVEREQEQAVS